MKIGMKFLCAVPLLAVLLAIFCEGSCPFISAKSAEAGKMSINYTDTAESYTVSVISAETSSVLGRIAEVAAVIILLVLIFSGGWVLLVIVGVIYAVVKYILTGQ